MLLPIAIESSPKLSVTLPCDFVPIPNGNYPAVRWEKLF